MKKEPGQDMTIGGKQQQEGLIDEYMMVINPIVLGKDRTMFDGIEEHLSLKPTTTRTFGNRNVLRC